MKNEKEILRFKENGDSVYTICKRLKIKGYQVYYVLQKHNIQLKSRLDISQKLLQEINRVHKTTSLSLVNLSKKYNIEKTYLCKLLNGANLSKIEIKYIILLDKKNVSPSIIGQRLSITTNAVKNVLEEGREELGKKLLERVGLTKEDIKEIRDKNIYNRARSQM